MCVEAGLVSISLDQVLIANQALVPFLCIRYNPVTFQHVFLDSYSIIPSPESLRMLDCSSMSFA